MIQVESLLDPCRHFAPKLSTRRDIGTCIGKVKGKVDEIIHNSTLRLLGIRHAHIVRWFGTIRSHDSLGRLWLRLRLRLRLCCWSDRLSCLEQFHLATLFAHIGIWVDFGDRAPEWPSVDQE